MGVSRNIIIGIKGHEIVVVGFIGIWKLGLEDRVVKTPFKGETFVEVDRNMDDRC